MSKKAEDVVAEMITGLESQIHQITVQMQVLAAHCPTVSSFASMGEQRAKLVRELQELKPKQEE